MTLEEIAAVYPGLVPSLVAHPGVGFITVRTDQRGTVVLGRRGTRYLEEGRVEGVDPLAAFGPSAAAEVLRHSELAHVGDLVLNSPLDAGTGEVGAYEELVGNHGGLGGWQTQAVLVHPAAWPVDEAPLRGADAVHRQLVSWLRHVGQRASIADPAPAAADGSAEDGTARPPVPPSRDQGDQGEQPSGQSSAVREARAR
jgi:hypothetical protein